MKTVLVTGASGGIGKAICLEFARGGYNVALCYNNGENEAKIIEKEILNFNKNVMSVKCDLTDALRIYNESAIRNTLLYLLQEHICDSLNAIYSLCFSTCHRFYDFRA